MFHLSLEVMSVGPWSMMWISLDDATEAQSNTDSTVKASQNLFCFYSCGYCMAEIMPPSIKSEEVQICDRQIFCLYVRKAHTHM